MSSVEQQLSEILALLRSVDARLARLDGQGTVNRSTALVPTTGVPNTGKKVSIREFLKEKSPEGGVQKALVIAFYLEYLEGVTPFNKADLEKAFRAAKEPLPPNINDKVLMCVKSGYMMEAAEKKNGMKAWLITRTGEEYVTGSFTQVRNG